MADLIRDVESASMNNGFGYRILLVDARSGRDPLARDRHLTLNRAFGMIKKDLSGHLLVHHANGCRQLNVVCTGFAKD